MNKNVFLSAVAVFALTACSNNSDEQPRQPGETEIRLSAGLDVEAGTRGITDNSYTGTAFSGGETIDVNIKETNNGTSATYGTDGWVTATIGAGGSGATLSPACYWPASGAGIDIYAWYPASTTTTYWTTATPARSAFVVPEDQSGTTTNHKAFDLMYATAEGGTGTNNQTVAATNREAAINLQFTHKLAKLVVTLAPKSGGGVTADQLKNATVTIGDVKTTVNVTPATGGVTTADSPTSTLKVMDNEAGTTGYALIPAQTLSGTLTVTLKAGGTLTTTLNDFVVQAGKTNTLNVSVSLTAISITTSIQEWTPNNTAGSADMKL